MNRDIYKLDILTEDEDGSLEYRKFFLDVNHIIGFYIPDKEEQIGSSGINILISNGTISVKQEDKIMDYLMENFVENAK
jgi:hypothetical protein